MSKEQEEWLDNNCRYKYGQFLGNFRNVPEEWSTEEFFLEAVRKAGKVLEYVPDAWKTEAVCFEAVRQQGGFALKDVPEALVTEALCHEAVRSIGRTLEYVPDALRTEAVCVEAVMNDKDAIKFVPKPLKDKVKAALRT